LSGLDAGNEKIGCSGEPFWLSLSSKLNLASTIKKKLEEQTPKHASVLGIYVQ
jgi:hypothetical protein